MALPPGAVHSGGFFRGSGDVIHITERNVEGTESGSTFCPIDKKISSDYKNSGDLCYFCKNKQNKYKS